MHVTASDAIQLGWQPSVKLLSVANDVYSTRNFMDLFQLVWLFVWFPPEHIFEKV